MGEYWKPVNIDKREQVHPHNVGDGLKRRQWMYWDDTEEVLAPSATNKRVADLIGSGAWEESDEVRAVSDYGGATHLRGKQTDRPAGYFDNWRDVSTPESPDAP